MPITIGPFDNVPAPGDPIRSNWAQELTYYVYPAIPDLQAGAASDDARLDALEKQRGLVATVAAYAVVTTNADGDANIPFGVTFTAAPAITVTGHGPPWGVLWGVRNDWTNTTSMYVHAVNSSTLAPMANASLGIYYNAYGIIA